MGTSLLHPAWVLHYRPYKETSVIADLLTPDVGKVTVVASGVRRRSKKGRADRLLQPFTTLNVSWRGRSELKTLTYTETERIIPLKGKHLFCGLYANELLIRLLQPHVPVDGVWELYHWLITALATESLLEPLLRLFEKNLLAQLGYALPLTTEGATAQPISPEKFYTYSPCSGFSSTLSSKLNDGKSLVFPGRLLLAYAENRIDDAMLPLLKRLNRMALSPLLGDKPLNSRSLFSHRL